VFKLIKRFQGYHRTFNQKNFEEIEQCNNSPELGTAPTPNEICSALKCMKNNKAFSKVMTNMLEPPIWLHTTPNWFHPWILDQPQNWLWIMAQDKNIKPIQRKRRPPRSKQLVKYLLKRNKETSAKIVSIIITRRLLKQLKKVGITLQFGHISCQEALHSISWSLLLRRQHGLPSYVLFTDLINGFNTIQHELLFQILSKYSIPKELINIMKKMLQGKAHHLRNKLWNWHPTRWQHGSATLPLCNASHHGNPWAFQHHKNQIMILS